MTLPRSIAPGNYYHIYNRGAFKQNIFRSDADRKRFLFTLLYYQSPEDIHHTTRRAAAYDPEFGFQTKASLVQTIIEKRIVSLTSFCLMSNHFHLLVREETEGGLASYMQRVSIGHTHYMNTKYGTSGHIFQGRYRSVHVRTNHQLLYLSAYIHKNPREIATWRETYFSYPWSSLQDLTEANRWGGLLDADIIAEQFDAEPQSNYADFVKTSTAKIFEDELSDALLLTAFHKQEPTR
jgi:putative transposase